MGIAQLGLFNLILIDMPSLHFAKFIIYREGYRAEQNVGNN